MAQEDNSKVSSPQDDSKKSKSKQNRSKKRTKPRPYGTTPKEHIIQRNAKQIKNMENQALQRFSVSPPLMGFPEE